MRLNATLRFISRLCAIALLSLGPASAQTPQAPQLQGSYTFDATASDDINAAIKVATKQTPFYAKSKVISELKKNTRPSQRIEIHYTQTEMSISTDQWGTIKTLTDGTIANWTRGDGEKYKVSTVWECGGLKQTFKGNKGQRINTYTLSADGKTLTIQISITSPPWLKQPLMYKLTYRLIP
jgi:hypothetical protein